MLMPAACEACEACEPGEPCECSWASAAKPVTATAGVAYPEGGGDAGQVGVLTPAWSAAASDVTDRGGCCVPTGLLLSWPCWMVVVDTSVPAPVSMSATDELWCTAEV